MVGDIQTLVIAVLLLGFLVGTVRGVAIFLGALSQTIFPNEVAVAQGLL